MSGSQLGSQYPWQQREPYTGSLVTGLLSVHSGISAVEGTCGEKQLCPEFMTRLFLDISTVAALHVGASCVRAALKHQHHTECPVGMFNYTDAPQMLSLVNLFPISALPNYEYFLLSESFFMSSDL